MGITYKIDTRVGVVYAVGSGNIGTEEIKSYRERLFTDPNYRAGLKGIYDYRKGRLKFSGDEARGLAQRGVDRSTEKRIAVVVSPDNYGFARMYQGWAGEDQDINVFTDMHSAREWIGLPPKEE